MAVNLPVCQELKPLQLFLVVTEQAALFLSLHWVRVTWYPLCVFLFFFPERHKPSFFVCFWLVSLLLKMCMNYDLCCLQISLYNLLLQTIEKKKKHRGEGCSRSFSFNRVLISFSGLITLFCCCMLYSSKMLSCQAPCLNRYPLRRLTHSNVFNFLIESMLLQNLHRHIQGVAFCSQR